MTHNKLNQFFTAYKYVASKYNSCNHFIRSLALARNHCCCLSLYCYTNLLSDYIIPVALKTSTWVGPRHVFMPWCHGQIQFIFQSLSRVSSSMLSLLAAALPTCKHLFMFLRRLLAPGAHMKANNHGCYSYINNSHESNARRASIIWRSSTFQKVQFTTILAPLVQPVICYNAKYNKHLVSMWHFKLGSVILSN